jgi:hypothetical protein
MPENDILKDFGRRWLPSLLLGWAILQAFDVGLTYWGLSLPTIREANPVMMGLIEAPVRVILVKSGLTLLVMGLLLKIEYRSRFSSIPVLAFLNLLMFYVFFNNWSLIARAGGLFIKATVSG